MDLAPIGVSTYSRLNHLKQTIKSLQGNTLAKQSELHIFSDAPKQGDEKKVQAVRDYLETIDGFKEVHIYERKENNRVANNRGGMRMLLDKYEKIIFVEEDVVASPYFLRFMNDALNVHKDDDRILGITGYGMPIEYPKNHAFDTVLGKRAFCWSFGIWKDKFEKIIMHITPYDYLKLRLNPFALRRYRLAGDNVLPQLRHVAYGKVEALDIRMDFTMNKYGLYFVYPKYSMITPTGLDGSGEHWTVSTNKFDTTLSDRALNVDRSINVRDDIICQMKEIHQMSYKQHCAFFLAELGLWEVLLWLRKSLLK